MDTELVPLTITNDVLDAAYHELLVARAKQRELSQASASVVHAIAPALVATELRRLAGEMKPQYREFLLSRADDLDPPA